MAELHSDHWAPSSMKGEHISLFTNVHPAPSPTPSTYRMPNSISACWMKEWFQIRAPTTLHAAIFEDPSLFLAPDIMLGTLSMLSCIFHLARLQDKYNYSHFRIEDTEICRRWVDYPPTQICICICTQIYKQKQLRSGRTWLVSNPDLLIRF